MPGRCVQDEAEKKAEGEVSAAGGRVSFCVPGAPFPVIFFLSCILKLCDYTIVPTHWILVKMKCVNHEKHSEQWQITDSCTMCYYFYWCIYLIQSKVAVVLCFKNPKKMSIY